LDISPPLPSKEEDKDDDGEKCDKKYAYYDILVVEE